MNESQGRAPGRADSRSSVCNESNWCKYIIFKHSEKAEKVKSAGKKSKVRVTESQGSSMAKNSGRTHHQGLKAEAD